MKELGGINKDVPGIVNICMDKVQDGEGSGRLYHCYTKEPIEFYDEFQLLREMDKLFDMINYPQAATGNRGFTKAASTIKKQEEEKVLDGEQVIGQAGEKGTFVVRVQYRQNATWQGQVVWAEKKKTKSFRSALELLKLIDGALDHSDQGDSEEENSNEN